MKSEIINKTNFKGLARDGRSQIRDKEFTLRIQNFTKMNATVFIPDIDDTNNCFPANLWFRVRDERHRVDIKACSELVVIPKYFDCSKMAYRRTKKMRHSERTKMNRTVRAIILLIIDKYTPTANKEWLQQLIQNHLHPEDAPISNDGRPTLTERFAEFIAEKKFTGESKSHFISMCRRLQRYEAWKRDMEGQPDFHLYVENFSRKVLEDFIDYMRNEYEYYQTYPTHFLQFDIDSRVIRPVSPNSLTSLTKRVKTFLYWASAKGILTDDSFTDHRCDGQVFGTPYYLTLAERDALLDVDLSDTPRLAMHRDKFVFQCLVGCRRGDLDRLGWGNIIDDGILVYMPQKTKERTGVSVRVPLGNKAKMILARQDRSATTLFPCFCQETYNADVKEIFRRAGLNRMVTVINPLTRIEEQKPICEIASSHLARRTFIGNLYKRTKDPSLIGAMSGHIEGSAAFRRYRAIDDEMKQELIDMMQ